MQEYGWTPRQIAGSAAVFLQRVSTTALQEHGGEQQADAGVAAQRTDGAERIGASPGEGAAQLGPQ